MSKDSEYSLPDYERNYALPDNKPLAIRLIQIQERIGNGRPEDSTIVLRMRVVDLDPEQLHSGESAEPSGRPSVRFDEEMNVERPEELERFCIARCSMAPGHKGKLDRWVAKLKPEDGHKMEDRMLVPTSEIPKGEPMVRKRFKWGNYVAMSYTWGKKEEWEMTAEEKEAAKDGDEDDTDNVVHEVILDGRRIRVRYNLWVALLAFREMDPFKKGALLWNDALCINQQYDTKAGREDLARQIPLMSLIYRQAGNIIIHVGDRDKDNEDTHEVVNYLQTIGTNYRTEYYEALDHAEPTVAHSHRSQARLKLEKSATAWAEAAQVDMRTSLSTPQDSDRHDALMISLYNFFDRPYWRRLWIIQELAMAHHSSPIVCGKVVTQWRYIRDGALLLSMIANTLRDAMQRALQRRGRDAKCEPSFEHVAAIAELALSGNRRQVPQTGRLLLMLQPGVMRVEDHSAHGMLNMTNVHMPLMQMLPGSFIHQSLVLAADTQCARERDRVLGLLAIPALARLPLRNDKLFADLPTTDIYLQYARACIEADHSLDIFSLVEGGLKGPDEGRHFPSWCPRFHVKSKIGRIEGEWHAPPRRPKYDPNHLNSIDFEFTMSPDFEGDSMLINGWVVDAVDGLGALSASDMPDLNPGSLFKGGVVPPRGKPDWSTVEEYRHTSSWDMKPDVQAIPDQIWSAFVGGTGTRGKKAPASFKCLLSSFPESRSPNDGFPYQRNWDFFMANRNLSIDGKPLGSYFNIQPTGSYSENVIGKTTGYASHEVAEAHRAMEARTKLRRMMTTATRPLMGLVPASTQPGDKVIVLWYHSRPLIATPLIREGESEDFCRWKLKGEAFIPGLMDGELADAGELDPMAMTRFEFV